MSCLSFSSVSFVVSASNIYSTNTAFTAMPIRWIFLACCAMVPHQYAKGRVEHTHNDITWHLVTLCDITYGIMWQPLAHSIAVSEGLTHHSEEPPSIQAATSQSQHICWAAQEIWMACELDVSSNMLKPKKCLTRNNIMQYHVYIYTYYIYILYIHILYIIIYTYYILLYIHIIYIYIQLFLSAYHSRVS